MALTRTKIIFNYRKALAQADELDSVASSLKRLYGNTLQNAWSTISANWEGESAIRYLSKGETLSGKISTTAQYLETLADEIRTAARRIYEAEMRNLRLAQQRSSKS